MPYNTTMNYATTIYLQYGKSESEESSDSESETESADENNDDQGYLFYDDEEYYRSMILYFNVKVSTSI